LLALLQLELGQVLDCLVLEVRILVKELALIVVLSFGPDLIRSQLLSLNSFLGLDVLDPGQRLFLILDLSPVLHGPDKDEHSLFGSMDLKILGEGMSFVIGITVQTHNLVEVGKDQSKLLLLRDLARLESGRVVVQLPELTSLVSHVLEGGVPGDSERLDQHLGVSVVSCSNRGIHL